MFRASNQVFARAQGVMDMQMALFKVNQLVTFSETGGALCTAIKR